MTLLAGAYSPTLPDPYRKPPLSLKARPPKQLSRAGTKSLPKPFKEAMALPDTGAPCLHLVRICLDLLAGLKPDAPSHGKADVARVFRTVGCSG